MGAKHKQPSGFTIVELLIVIVVIAILAAISIVAYNGIQQRAKNTQTTTALAAYSKALKGYYAVNQSFPGAAGATGCFGNVGTGCGYLSGSSASCNGSLAIGSAVYQADFGNGVKTITTTIPDPNSQEVACGDSKHRGVVYTNFGTALAIYAFYKGVSDCPLVSGLGSFSTTVWGDGLLCAYTLSGA